MRMVRKMDAGPIVGQEIVPIQNEDTGITLRNVGRILRTFN